MASNDSSCYDFFSEENSIKWKDLFKDALQKVYSFAPPLPWSLDPSGQFWFRG